VTERQKYFLLAGIWLLSLSVSQYPSVALQPFIGPWPLFQSLNLFTQSVGLLGRGISPSQGRYLHTGQHTDIHALSGIRTHDPSVRASEDSSWLRPRGHSDGQLSQYTAIKTLKKEQHSISFSSSPSELNWTCVNLTEKHGRTPWMGDHPVGKAATYTRKNTITEKDAEIHPCLQWDSNLSSQCSSEWRHFVPSTARSMLSANAQIKKWKFYSCN
jgi:hypothetical protein